MPMLYQGVLGDFIFSIALLIFNFRFLKSKISLIQCFVIFLLSTPIIIYSKSLITALLIIAVIASYSIYILKINYYTTVANLYLSFTSLLICCGLIKLFSYQPSISHSAYMAFYILILLLLLVYPKPVSELTDFKYDKKVLDIIVILLLTSSSFIVFFLLLHLTETSLIIAIVVHLSAVTSLYLVSVINKYHFKCDSLKQELETFKDLNIKMRSQKHDFNNHLQVICSLIQARKHNTCFDYIININKHGFSKDNINTGMLAINALLSSKKEIAKNESIDFNIEILDTIPHCFNMQSWEIVTILGNLIDNAIYAEKNSKHDRKSINVTLKKNGDYLDFIINNLGSYIEPSTLSKIFQPGFSLKGNNNQGMGLHIIKNCVERHDGSFMVKSTLDGGTTFYLSFPQEIPSCIMPDIV